MLALCAALSLLCLLAAGPASAADPRVGEERWLQRVVPASAALPPAEDIPPIAIIETGVDRAHPDMGGGWVTQRRPSPAPAPSDTAGIAYVRDGVAHGTAVAGLIGAPRDGVGMEGLLPGARVRVYGDNGSCRDVAAAIRRAVRDGARVINASYGFAEPCIEHQDATNYAFGRDVLIVAAAGNDRGTSRVMQPANDFHVLTVGALNALDQPTGFTHQNYYVDLAAPGEDVLVPIPVWADVEDEAADGYTRWDGTSFSAPMVAAAAAWIMARRPGLTADQVAEVLRRSARDVHRPGWDISTGWGALDLGAALRQAAPRHDLSEPNDDIRWAAGRAGFAPDPPFLRRRARQTIRARLDALKDPYDVYPLWLPARSSVEVRLAPVDVAADLYVWGPAARTAYGRGALAKSRRAGLATEVVRIANRAPVGRRVWIDVRIVPGRSLSGEYALRMARRR